MDMRSNIQQNLASTRVGGSSRSARAQQRSRSTDLRNPAAASVASHSTFARRHFAAVLLPQGGGQVEHFAQSDGTARLKAAMGQQREDTADLVRKRSPPWRDSARPSSSSSGFTAIRCQRRLRQWYGAA